MKSWEETLITELKENEKDYVLRSLLDELLDLNKRQLIRIEQLNGELDGTAWSPSHWGSND